MKKQLNPKNKHVRYWTVSCVTIFTWAALFCAYVAADIKVLRSGRPIESLPIDLQLSEQAFSVKDQAGALKPKTKRQFNRGLVGQEILRWVDHGALKGFFGLKAVDAEIFPSRRIHADTSGVTARFVQRHHRIHIEGAEAVFSFDSLGRLKTVSSSWVPTPEISVQTAVSRVEARRVALNALKYRAPEFAPESTGQGEYGRLKIVYSGKTTSKPGVPLLVWDFFVRESELGEHPVQIQIAAAGPRAGQVYKVVNAAHSADPGLVTIYDASFTVITPNPIFKGVRVLRAGKPILSKEGDIVADDDALQIAHRANDRMEAVKSFFKDLFGQNSFDGSGAAIDVSVNVQKKGFLDLLGQRQNAAWIGPWRMFVFGAGGDELSGFESAYDVVGHEFTHAVIQSTSDLAYEGESGALNEHLADVFGELVQYRQAPLLEKNFLIGEEVVTDQAKAQYQVRALRDMRNPNLGLSKQPADLKQYPKTLGKNCVQPTRQNDNCGVHVLSGIPNRAAAQIIMALGEKRASVLFYRVMTLRLRPDSQFLDYRREMLEEADHLNLDVVAVRGAFDSVGIQE